MNDISKITIKCELTMNIYDKNGKIVGEQIITIPRCKIKETEFGKLELEMLSNYPDPL